MVIGFDVQLLARELVTNFAYNSQLTLNQMSCSTVVNVGLGTYLYSDGASNIFWVYVSYALFIVTLFSLLYVIFTGSAIVNRNPGECLGRKIVTILLKAISIPFTIRIGPTAPQAPL